MNRSGSSRWCPTQEQLIILEEMYGGGIRTPNASQIQHIAAQLSLYGKIEGKNVFYWFQNHKARERQKLRRRLNKQLQLQHQLRNYHLQLHLNQNYNHHFHRNRESVISASSSQLHYFYNSLASFSEGGSGEASKQGIDYKWKTDNAEGVVEETLKEDWRMMMEVGLGQVGPAASYWPRPLKTLELFPIRDRLKEV